MTYLNNPDAEVQFTEVLLHKVKVASKEAVTARFLRDAELRSWQEPVMDRLVYSLQSYVLSFPGTYRWRIEHREPATWWDSLKATHAPRWYRRRHPIRETFYCRTVEFDGRLIFPGANLNVPKLGPVRLATFTGLGS